MKLVITIYFLAATFVFSGGLLVSDMEDGDKIEVTLHSTGCFHDATSYYEIKRSDGAYRFSEYEVIWGKSLPRRILKKEAIGSTSLSKKDVVGLDELLKFYRRKKDAFSTTQVSLVIHYYESNDLVQVERLKDESGGYGLENKESVVRFHTLTKRFEAKVVEAGHVEPVVPAEEPKSEEKENSSTESR